MTREEERSRVHQESRVREFLVVVSLYVVLSCVMTWPLVLGLSSDVPGDLGDSLLNMWILGWGAESVPRIISGDMSLAQFAHANIFHPEPLALSFSEHLFGQVLQILPLYHLTGNLILGYNVLFLSTFALSGVGMYVLVHDITGNRHAALFAGLVFAFVPYRVAQISHIQSLSSQWMPFALYGFRRYITTSRVRALTGGVLALLMQNWSSGYYLVFFAPFVVLFVLHQLVAARRAREWKMWRAFVLAALVVAGGTLPFLTMYLAAQRVHGFERPLGEIIGFSADIYSYLTAPEALRVAGPVVQAWPKPEGELFLGFVPALVALIGFAAFVAATRPRAPVDGAVLPAVQPRRFSLRGTLVFVLSTFAVALLAGFLGILFTGGFITSVATVPIRATNASRILVQLALVTLALVAISSRFRSTLAALLASPAGIAAVSLMLALWLSLGPIARSRGQSIDGLGLYGLLLDNVPGFGGLRVPARYAMVAAVYLALLAGLGAAWIMRPGRWSTRRTRAVAVVLCVAVLVEAAFAPLPVNQTWGDGTVMPPDRVEPRSNAPAVYRQLAAIPGDAVVAEFPFGDPAWELRYVYYSTVHWKRVLNGYSGGFPHGYKIRVARLQRFASAPDDAWVALRSAGTTHVIVHEAALDPAEANAVRRWLETRGARELGRFDSDVLYDLTHAR